MASSSIFANGMLRESTAASPPSASTHAAAFFMPVSRNSVVTGTPVHSEQLVMPSTSCGDISGFGARYAARPLPEHSMK